MANELPLASLSLGPIDIDEIAPLPPSVPGLLEQQQHQQSTSSTTPLSASRLRLLQDTTMIESALDLDSLEEPGGGGSQAGLIRPAAAVI